MFGVFQSTDVQEGGADPVKSHVHVRYGMENYLCIQVLHQVCMQAENNHFVVLITYIDNT